MGLTPEPGVVAVGRGTSRNTGTSLGCRTPKESIRHTEDMPRREWPWSRSTQRSHWLASVPVNYKRTLVSPQTRPLHTTCPMIPGRRTGCNSPGRQSWWARALYRQISDLEASSFQGRRGHRIQVVCPLGRCQCGHSDSVRTVLWMKPTRHPAWPDVWPLFWSLWRSARYGRRNACNKGRSCRQRCACTRVGVGGTRGERRYPWSTWENYRIATMRPCSREVEDQDGRYIRWRSPRIPFTVRSNPHQPLRTFSLGRE